MGTSGLLRGVMAEFDRRLGAVADDQWGSATPCTDWDVRALVNHVVYEALWMPSLLEGQTITQIGDRFEGDILGADPKATWKEASEAAAAAVDAPGALERTVHLSFGDFPGEKYVADVVSDIIIHTWDLARAVGADERLEPAHVEAAYGNLEPQVEAWRSAGVLAAAVEVPPGADLQTRLLAMVGRQA